MSFDPYKSSLFEIKFTCSYYPTVYTTPYNIFEGLKFQKLRIISAWENNIILTCFHLHKILFYTQISEKFQCLVYFGCKCLSSFDNLRNKFLRLDEKP